MDTEAPDKSLITVNVGNSVLLSDTYDLGQDKKTLSFINAIEAGTPIEVRWYIPVTTVSTTLTGGADTDLSNLTAIGNQKILPVGGEIGDIIVRSENGTKWAAPTGITIGTVFMSDLKYPNMPAGALEYNGTEIVNADTTYPEFWKNWLVAGKMNTGSYTDYETAMTANGGTCPFFALDIANKKFKTPTWADGVFAAAATTEGEINKYYNAGLPNITGDWNSAQYVDAWSSNGAVYGIQNNSAEHNSSSQGMRAYFDASRSNPIYGASDTVTPKHVRKRWFVQVANAIETTAYHNIDGALSTKVNKSGDTMTGTLQMSGENEVRFGTDDNYYSIKKGTDGLIQRNGTDENRLLTTADLQTIVQGTISQFTHGTHTNGQPYFIIKFTNGLIIQGIKAVGNATTNWPTPFSTQVLSVLFGDTPLVDNEGSAITGWTLTNVSNSQKYGRRSPFIVGIGI